MHGDRGGRHRPVALYVYADQQPGCPEDGYVADDDDDDDDESSPAQLASPTHVCVLQDRGDPVDSVPARASDFDTMRVDCVRGKTAGAPPCQPQPPALSWRRVAVAFHAKRKRRRPI